MVCYYETNFKECVDFEWTLFISRAKVKKKKTLNFKLANASQNSN